MTLLCVQCAHRLEDRLSPAWGRRFWAAADRHGGCWLPDAQHSLASMLRDTAQDVCDVHPIVTDNALTLEQKLERLPPQLHPAVCRRETEGYCYGPLRCTPLCIAGSASACAMAGRLLAALPQVGPLLTFELNVCGPAVRSPCALAAVQAIVASAKSINNVTVNAGGTTCTEEVDSNSVTEALEQLAAECAPKTLGIRLEWEDRYAVRFASMLISELHNFVALRNLSIQATHRMCLNNWEALCSKVGQLPALEHLYLHLKFSPGATQSDDIKRLAKGVAELSMLSAVIIEGDAVPIADAYEVLAALAAATQATQLIMSCSSNQAQQEAMSSSLACMAKLQELRLQRDSQACLVASLKSLTNLTHLECSMGRTLDVPHMLLAHALPHVTSLQYAVLDGVSDCGGAAEHAACQAVGALHHLCQLTSLRLTLGCCSKTPATLPAQFSSLSVLQRLHLRFDAYVEAKAADAAQYNALLALRGLVSLRALDVQNVQGSLAPAMSVSLASLSNLESLELNCVDDESADVAGVVSGFSQTDRLKRLYLDRCFVDEAAAAVLTQVMRKHRRLMSVSVHHEKRLHRGEPSGVQQLRRSAALLPCGAQFRVYA